MVYNMKKNRIYKYLKLYSTSSVFFKSFIKSFLIIAVIFTLITIYVYQSVKSSSRSSIENSYSVQLKSTENSVDEAFKGIDYVASNIVVNSNVQMYFLDYDKRLSSYDDFLRTYIISYTSILKYIDSIYFYNIDKGRIYSLDGEYDVGEFSDKGWLLDFDSGFEKNTKLFARKKNSGYPQLFTLIKKSSINSVNIAVVINVDMKKLKKQVIGDIPGIYITDSSTILYSTDDTSLFLKPADGELSELLNRENRIENGSVFLTEKSKYYDFYYTLAAENGSVVESEHNLNKIILIISGVFLIISIIIAFMISSITFNPISGIFEVIDSYKLADTENLEENEIKYIVRFIMELIESNKTLKTELDKGLSQYRKANLEALQHQISPHFFTNTLGRINREVEKNEGYHSEAGKMLVKLSRLTAYCMKQENTFVHVSDELECAELYASLMKGKYGGFEFKENIEPGCEKYKIIKMTLQPIIENAIYHGVAGMDNGVVELDIHTDEKSLFISVKDNGAGMDEQKARELNIALNSGINISDRIGIYNVAERLQLGMGCRDFIKIKSEPGIYTEVKLKIPKELM